MTKAKDDKMGSHENRPKDSRAAAETSGNREERAAGSDKDKLGRQSSASSGTTPLGGEASDDKPGPGGIEGTGGSN